MDRREAVIVGAARTPIGGFQGALRDLSATELGSIAVREALLRARLSAAEVDEVIMGNVLSAGLGQAPARQAALGAGLSHTVGGTTINKVCGSGLVAVMMAARMIRLGEAQVVVAGGMESMSNAPYLLPGARDGLRMGHAAALDSMIKDGLWDAYNDFHMGAAAELCADKFAISRQEQDEFAAQSYERAQRAQRNGEFASEIVPVVTKNRGGKQVKAEIDEEVGKFDRARMGALRPAFRSDGTVTAGNASSISDGAAAVAVMSSEKALAHGLKPLARIRAWSSAAREPEWFTVAPVPAIRKLLDGCGLEIKSVDLFEINEAFAASSIAVNRQLDLDPAKVNVRGGAIALGHPIGASGARILTSLLYALRDLGKQRGIASLCIGGGEAVALMVERPDR